MKIKKKGEKKRKVGKTIRDELCSDESSMRGKRWFANFYPPLIFMGAKVEARFSFSMKLHSDAL